MTDNVSVDAQLDVVPGAGDRSVTTDDTRLLGREVTASDVVLRDGATVGIRSIEPGDRINLARFHEALSVETIRSGSWAHIRTSVTRNSSVSSPSTTRIVKR